MHHANAYSYASILPANSNGINDCWDATTKSRLKRGSTPDDGNPLLVVNEWICGSICQYLRLPIPPFALLRKNNEKVYFASLHFSIEDTPDDVDAETVWEHFDEEAAGVLLFDIFVCNNDRHNGNLKVDDPVSPKRLFVFDHDQALFGCLPGDEVKRLDSMRDRLGVTGSNVSKGNRHCLIDVIDSADWFSVWVGAITEIPDRFIREVCREVVGFGIDVNLAEYAYDFLCDRKRRFDTLLNSHKDEFTQITDWGIL